MSKSHKCTEAATDIQTAANIKSNKTRLCLVMKIENSPSQGCYTMKLKCNWLICLRYILEPPLNPFKAHIELQMSSYVNEKAIKLIALFVGFAPLNDTI